MNNSSIKLGTAYLLALGLATLHATAQGNLTPPGAPAPTMKTLDQIEPRIDVATLPGNSSYHHLISSPGSYYLSGNLEVTKTSGIFINVPDVTLDLNGFKIYSPTGSIGEGIRIYGAQADRVTVRNGTLTGFDYGIRCFLGPKGSLFQKLAVSDCSSYGIYAGPGARMIDCRVDQNAGVGIYADQDANISGCTVSGNQGSYGIYAGDAAAISGCTVNGNAGIGIYAPGGTMINRCVTSGNQTGISAGAASTILGCSVKNSLGVGISAGEACRISDCAVKDNHASGISAASDASISGCTAYGTQGDYGIYAGPGSQINNCSANHNTGTGSNSYGIYAESGSSIIQCVASYNGNTNLVTTATQGIGIYVATNGVVQNCTASFNRGDGIRVVRNSLVTGNACNGNGQDGDGAGISSVADQNRIDGNTAMENDHGIQIGGIFNLVVRNSATGNSTNFPAAGSLFNDIANISGSPSTAGAWDNFTTSSILP